MHSTQVIDKLEQKEVKLYAHPKPNWPFPQWLPYPYKAPKEVKVYPDNPF